MPNYDESDTFLAPNGEELVRLSDGSFRAENESGFERFRYDGSTNRWTGEMPDGTRAVYGAMAESRIEALGDCQGNCVGSDKPCTGDSECQRTFRWYLTETQDPNGNLVRYRYAPPEQLSAPFHVIDRMVYPTTIEYSRHVSSMPNGWHVVAFEWGMRPDPVLDYRAGFEVITVRRLRRIVVCSVGVSAAQPGGIACPAAIAGGGSATLVRTYRLDYQDESIQGCDVQAGGICRAGLLGAGCSTAADCFGGVSRLARITQAGSDGVDYSDRPVSQRSGAIPPARFEYSDLDFTSFRGSSSGWQRVLLFPSGQLSSADTTTIDLNSDGLPDVMELATAGRRWWENLGPTSDGIVRFAAPANFPGPQVRLQTPGTQVADMDGDGLSDVITAQSIAQGEFRLYRGTGEGRFESVARPFRVPNYAGYLGPQGFESPEVEMVDLNFDKRTDVLRTVGNGSGGTTQFQVLISSDAGLSALPPCAPVSGAYLPGARASLADLNGDRLLDLVVFDERFDSLAIQYFPAVGRGAFGRDGTCDDPGPSFNVVGGPAVADYRARREAYSWQDLTNDGISDLVYLGPDRVRLWVNVAGFSLRLVADVRFPTTDSLPHLRLLDVNGNGTTDVLLAERAGTGNAWYLDFSQPHLSPPNLLTRTTNGIGRVIDIGYASSSIEYARDRSDGRRWRTRIPFPVSVVSRRTISFGLDLDGAPGEDRYVTEYRYHDGYYDGREKEFRGFGEVEVIEHGDASAPTLVTRHRFHTGAPDGVNNDGDGLTDEFTETGGAEEESLKGKPLESRREVCAGKCAGSASPCSSDADCGGAACGCSGTGPAFDHVFHRWDVRRLHASSACSLDPSVGCCSDADCAGKGTCTSQDAAHPARFSAHSCIAGKGVQFAVETGARTAVLERGAGPRRDLFVGLDYDDYGNKTREDNWGIVASSDLPPFGCTLVSGNCSDNPEASCSFDSDCFATCERRSLTDGNALCSGNPFAFTNPVEPADQVFKRMSYATNTNNWLLRYECGSRMLGCPSCASEASASGTVVEAESQQFYDNLALCQVAKGNVTRREERLESEKRWIARLTNQFDTFGNIIEARDARGSRRTLEYDSKFHTYPVTERVHLDGYANAPLPAGQSGTFSTGPYTLNMTAQYHEGFGVMIRSTSWGINATAGPESLYRYDTFGRLIATVQPGDSLAAPTYVYEYRLSNPDAQDLVGRSLNSVVSRRREAAGGGTVDAYAYVDGVGHKLGTKAEGDSSGEWIYSGAMGFNRRGTENRKWLEYATNSPAYEAPDPPQPLIATTYDATGRAIRVTTPVTGAPGEQASGAYAQTVYKPLSTDTYDENDTANITPGDFMTQAKDGLDRLIHVVERNHKNCGSHCGEYPTRYSYDARGNLTRILDAQSNQKLITYDSLGRKTFMNDPNRGHLTWTYDDTDNVIRTVDAKGQQNVFTYDRANRLRTEDYLDANSHVPDVSYTYDHPVVGVDLGDGSTGTARLTAGYPSSVYDLSGEEHTSYDERRRPEWGLKRVRDPKRPNVLVSFTTRMVYDSIDRTTQLVYPDGDGLVYEYDSRGLMTRVSGSGPAGQEILRDVQYRPSGQLASIEYGSGAVTSYGYDARQRLIDLRTTGIGWTEGRELVHFGYQFDPVSNIIAITDQRSGDAIPFDSPRRNSQHFDYDGLHRLTAYALSEGPSPGASIAYSYDKLGNMTAASSAIHHVDERTGLSLTNLGAMNYGGVAGSSGRVGRDPGAPPGPHALTAAERRSYAYDANGNMTEIEGQAAVWDHNDRLTRVGRPDMRADYMYDHTDRRITKRVRTTNAKGAAYDEVTTYVNRYFELREGGQPTKYVWIGDTRVAQIEATLDGSALRVQRLSLFEGWNQLTLAVTPGPNPLQIGGAGGAVVEVYRWRQKETPEYEPVTAQTPISPGDILWVRVSRPVEISVVGSYQPIPEYELRYPGESTYVGWRWLESTDDEPGRRIVERRSSSQWFFDAGASPLQRWRLLPPLGVPDILDDYPRWLGPGSVFYFKDPPVEYSISPVTPKARIRFYHQDHLGSTAAMSDMQGCLGEEIAYYPYGEPRNRYENRCGASRQQAYSFAQKERDEESGLHYLQARSCVGFLGTFASVDPLVSGSVDNVGGIHPYRYGRNNPLKFVDPTGLDAVAVGLDPRPIHQPPSAAYQTAMYEKLWQDYLRSVEITRNNAIEPSLVQADDLIGILKLPARLVAGGAKKSVSKLIGSEALKEASDFSWKVAIVKYAKSLQGKPPYDKIDDFRPIMLQKGTIIYQGWFGGKPKPGAFFITQDSLERTGIGKKQVWDSVQVARPYDELRAFVVTEDVPAAVGITRANAQHGVGGGTQIVIQNTGALQDLGARAVKQ